MAWTDSLLAAVHRARLRSQLAGQKEQKQRISNPWHAVSVVTGIFACRDAVALRDKRFLAKDAPTLPLPNCKDPSTCTCSFRHHADRRDGERRASDCGLPTWNYFGVERRGRARGQRVTDV